MSDSSIVVLNLNERELDKWMNKIYVECIYFGGKFALLKSINRKVIYVVNRIEKTRINGAMRCFFDINEIECLPKIVERKLVEEIL